MRFRLYLLLTCFLISPLVYAGNNFSIKTIVIDAGHGGKDPGAIGPKGTYEKDVALAVALKLGENIQKNYPNVKVVYTRKNDVFLELHERAEIANKNKADLFIAVHCNSNNNPEAYGSSTYVLGLHRTEANLEVAKRENSVILLEEDREKNYEFDPNTPEGHIIMSMKQNAFLDQSIDFASKIENQMENGARRKSLGVKQAGFYVLYKTAMPSLLAEIGFISNPEEEKYLSSEKGQDQIAHALYHAFKDYKMFMEKGEAETASAPPAKNEEPAAPTPTPVEEKPEPKKEPVKEPVREPVKEVAPPVAKEEPKPKTETPALQQEPVKPKQDSGSESVTLQDGKTIRKPIDVKSGGGKSSSAATKVQVKPTAPIVTQPVKEPETKKPEPATVKTEKPAETPVPVQKPVQPTTKAVEPVNKPEPVKTEAKPVSGIVFKVQLFALKGDLKPSDRDKLVRVFPNYSTEPTPSGFVRYYGAIAKTYPEAKRHLVTAVTNGYNDAFIAGFKDGRRLSSDEMKAAEGK